MRCEHSSARSTPGSRRGKTPRRNRRKLGGAQPTRVDRRPLVLIMRRCLTLRTEAARAGARRRDARLGRRGVAAGEVSIACGVTPADPIARRPCPEPAARRRSGCSRVVRIPLGRLRAGQDADRRASRLKTGLVRSAQTVSRWRCRRGAPRRR